MYADALLSILVVTAFFAVFYGPWQSVCTDWARQTIFASRDQLFDMARAGELSFESSDYRIIRSSLNSLIRFAHDVTWVEFASIYIGLRNVGAAERLVKESDLKAALDRIPYESTRNKVQSLVSDAQRAVVLMMAFKSLPLCIVLLATVVSETIRKRIKPVARSLRDTVQVEAEASCP